MLRRFLACAISALFAFSPGCGDPSKPAAAGSAKDSANGKRAIRLAVIPKGTTHVFWKSVEAGARAAGKELGVEVIWKGPLREDDRALQIQTVQQFIQEGVD